MKKIIMLDESDYSKIICHLDNIYNILYRMRDTKKKREAEKHLCDVFALLTNEDPDTRKMQEQINCLESCSHTH